MLKKESEGEPKTGFAHLAFLQHIHLLQCKYYAY
jgi:hypothetical protein